jgi:hypothetical protein
MAQEWEIESWKADRDFAVKMVLKEETHVRELEERQARTHLRSQQLYDRAITDARRWLRKWSSLAADAEAKLCGAFILEPVHPQASGF